MCVYKNPNSWLCWDALPQATFKTSVKVVVSWPGQTKVSKWRTSVNIDAWHAVNGGLFLFQPGSVLWLKCEVIFFLLISDTHEYKNCQKDDFKESFFFFFLPLPVGKMFPSQLVKFNSLRAELSSEPTIYTEHFHSHKTWAVELFQLAG